MRLEIAKDYYLGQMPQVEIVRKYELCETTVREILRKFAVENNKSALLMKNKTTDSLSEENKALRKEVMELKKKLYDETMRADDNKKKFGRMQGKAYLCSRFFSKRKKQT
jgi:transposase-like protein